MESVPYQGISPLIDAYQGYFIDLWGVVHNGAELYPGSLPLLDKLQKLGKQVVFLSNAPRRSYVVEDFLKSLGVTQDHFNHIVTSGEDTWATLAGGTNSFSSEMIQGKVYFMGMAQDEHMIHDCGLTKTDEIKEASFILATGVRSLGDSLSLYKDQLDEGVALTLPLICANPDKVVHIKGQEFMCAGSLAHYYEAQGGTVFYHGKPHGSVYERAYGLLGDIPKSKILAIGDSLHTDVQGAHNFGIDVAFIMGGIHKQEMLDGSHEERKNLKVLLGAYGRPPTYHVPFFNL